MSVKEQPWYPYVSVVVWGLGVFVLVLVNSGSLALALLLGAGVAFLSWWIERRGRQSG